MHRGHVGRQLARAVLHPSDPPTAAGGTPKAHRLPAARRIPGSHAPGPGVRTWEGTMWHSVGLRDAHSPRLRGLKANSYTSTPLPPKAGSVPRRHEAAAAACELRRAGRAFRVGTNRDSVHGTPAEYRARSKTCALPSPHAHLVFATSKAAAGSANRSQSVPDCDEAPAELETRREAKLLRSAIVRRTLRDRLVHEIVQAASAGPCVDVQDQSPRLAAGNHQLIQLKRRCVSES